MTPTTAQARPHIVGLDLWRGGLMLVGIALHGSMGLPATPLFVAIDVVSQTFRMGTFFAIAGMLTAFALQRRAPGAWIRRRVVQVGIPFAFGMTVISPFVWLMARLYGWPKSPAPLPFEWHHLWFLAALLIYSIIVYTLVRSGRADRIQRGLERDFERGVLRTSSIMLMTSVAIAILFGLAPVIMNATLSTTLFNAFRTIQLATGYLPMFLLGFLAGRSRMLCAAMLHRWRPAATIVVGVAAVYLAWFAVIVPAIDPAAAAAGTSRLRFLGAAIVPPAAFVLILRTAMSIRRVPALAQRISAASYTCYLLHVPIAVAINLALHPLGVNLYLSYIVAVVGSSLISFAFHEHVVARLPVVAFLLNGALPRGTDAPADMTATPSA